MEQLLDFGTLVFSKEMDGISLVFEPNEDIKQGREASILIKRDTAASCLNALEHYLFVDERPWQEIPARFFNADYVSDEE